MIKRRRNAIPLAVEREHRRSLVAPSPAPPRATSDRRIRVWNSEDRDARAAETFARKSKAEQYQEAVDAWVARYRRANDPDVWQEVGEQQVARHVAENAMSHRQTIEGPDPRIVVRPKDRERWAEWPSNDFA